MTKLLKAVFRKNKVGLIVLTLFIILAVFLMTAGITLSFRANTLYDEKFEEINSPEFIASVKSSVQGQPVNDKFIERMSALDYLKDVNVVENAHFNGKEDVIDLEGYDFDPEEMFFLNKDADTPYTPKMEKTADGEGIPVYFSSWMNMNVNYKFQAGTKLNLKVNGKEYKGYVAGFYESFVWLYSTTMYTDNASFELLKSLEPEKEICLNMVEFKFREFNFETENLFWKDLMAISEAVTQEYLTENNIPDELSKMYVLSIGLNNAYGTRQTSEPYVKLMSILMIVFSLVLTVIALIITAFLIRSGIKDDMRNLGISKALGYTTKQLRLSYLILYGSIIGVGAILGMIVAVSMMPVFSQIIRIISNMYFNIPANGLAAVISVIAVVGIALGAVHLTTRPLKNITPLFAIRGATESHSFKKNHFALDKTKTDLNTTLALKSIFNNRRQSVMIFVIVAIMTFLCSFSGVIYYNMNVNQAAIIEISGEENTDVSIYLNSNLRPEKATEIFDKVAALDGIEEMTTGIMYGEVLHVNNNMGLMYVAGDYSKLRTKSVYEGRYPEADNEIALSGVFAKNLNKKIGDVVTITKSGKDKEFIIVGLAQGLSASNYVYMTVGAYRQLIPGVEYDYVTYYSRNVYLQDGVDIDEFIEKVKVIAAEYPESKATVTNIKESIQAKVFDMIAPASKILLTIIFVITAIVAAAVIFMVIRMKMLREKKNFAVYKAVGYTTFGLMHQIGLSILLIALPASFIGSLLGGVLASPLITMAGGALGLMKVGFLVNYGYILLIFFGISALTYALALLASMSAKAISPRMLVTD